MTTRKILVCQHVGYEILGTLDPLFRKAGFRIRYCNFDRTPLAKPSLEGYSGLVILGGPMGVRDTDKYPYLLYELKLIENALKKNIPIVGICLGAQLISKALGGEISKNEVREIGWYDVTLTKEGAKDAILSHFQRCEKLFLWHGDKFTIPKGGTHLLSSKTCVHQAFSYGNNVYGFQFHLEVDPPTVERWLNIPLNQKLLESLGDSFSVEKIRKDTGLYAEHLVNLSHQTFRKLLPLFGGTRKFRRLASR